MLDYYHILGDHGGESRSAIRKAYLDQAYKYHPCREAREEEDGDKTTLSHMDSKSKEGRVRVAAEAFTILGHDKRGTLYDLARPKDIDTHRNIHVEKKLPPAIDNCLEGLNLVKPFNRVVSEVDLQSQQRHSHYPSPRPTPHFQTKGRLRSRSCYSPAGNQCRSNLTSPPIPTPSPRQYPSPVAGYQSWKSKDVDNFPRESARMRPRRVSFSEQTIASDELKMARDAARTVKTHFQSTMSQESSKKDPCNNSPPSNASSEAKTWVNSRFPGSSQTPSTGLFSRKNYVSMDETYQPLVSPPNGRGMKSLLKKERDSILPSQRKDSHNFNPLDNYFQPPLYSFQAGPQVEKRMLVKSEQTGKIQPSHRTNHCPQRTTSLNTPGQARCRVRSGSNSIVLPIPMTKTEGVQSTFVPWSSLDFDNPRSLGDKTLESKLKERKYRYLEVNSLPSGCVRKSVSVSLTPTFTHQTSAHTNSPKDFNYTRYPTSTSQHQFMGLCPKIPMCYPVISAQPKVQSSWVEARTWTDLEDSHTENGVKSRRLENTAGKKKEEESIRRLALFLRIIDGNEQKLDYDSMARSFYFFGGIKKVRWLIDLTQEELRKINRTLMKKAFDHDHREDILEKEGTFSAPNICRDHWDEDMMKQQIYYLTPLQETTLLRQLDLWKSKK